MRLFSLCIGIGVAVLFAGCGGGDESADTAGSQPPGTTNTPPTISGQALGSVRVGEPYSFQPTASDPDGDTLRFMASNVPSWATFNEATGRMTGTPNSQDVGTYAGISISVNDGKATISLAPFSIAVTQIAVGSATLSWTPPTTNVDGSVLSNLAGYRIRYGRNSSSLDQSVSITNPSINTYVLDNLSAGTWYFGLITVNSQGVESSLSNVASKSI